MKLNDLGKSLAKVPSILIEDLANEGTELGKQIKSILSFSFREYIRRIIPIDRPINNEHGFLVVQELSRLLQEYGYENEKDICDNLIRFPVIQTADHSNLLFDPETFLNNFLFHLACRENKISSMLCWQCSTVSCIGRRGPFWGPVFLNTRNQLFKVFPHSIRWFTRASFCGINEPTKISMDILDREQVIELDPFFKSFIGREFRNGPDSYRICNDDIWTALPIPQKTYRIGVDESLSARLISRHLRNKNSPIYRLIFDYSVRDTFVHTKREMIRRREYYCVNREAPDFFWFLQDKRLIPTILKGSDKDAYFVLEPTFHKLPIDNDQKAICEALESGILFPDKFLIYFVRNILPRIVAIGGTSQQDYVAMYKALILRTHKISPFLDPSDEIGIRSFEPSLLGGAPLLEMNAFQRTIIQNLDTKTNFEHFERSFIDREIRSTIGSLTCAKYFYSEFTKTRKVRSNEHFGN